MKVNDKREDGKPERLPDGLYMTVIGDYFGVEDGVLFLPAEMANPCVLVTSQRPVHLACDGQGAWRAFVRASDMMGLVPEQAQIITAIAAKFGCRV